MSIPLRQRLRDALPVAMKARDRVAVTALRATLSALDNAEAAPAPDRGMAIEHSPVGVGVADVQRRVLTEAQVADIVRAEIAEREAAAKDYERAGHADRAEQLRAEVNVLSAHLP